MLTVFRSKRSLILLFIPLIVVLFVFYFSSAHPIVYVMTICIYVPLMILLLKMVNYKTVLIVALLVTGTMAFSRLSPREQNINATDLTNLSFYQVTGGERIEQDFYLPKSDWRLTRLLDDSEVGTVLRIIGNISDEETHLFVNGHDIGSVSQLLLSKSPPMYSIPNAYNYILRFPKNDIADNPILSID